MKKNVGKLDKIIRIIVAVIFAIMGWKFSAWWFIVTAVALVTALMGYCGLYALFGINTIGKKKK